MFNGQANDLLPSVTRIPSLQKKPFPKSFLMKSREIAAKTAAIPESSVSARPRRRRLKWRSSSWYKGIPIKNGGSPLKGRAAFFRFWRKIHADFRPAAAKSPRAEPKVEISLKNTKRTLISTKNGA
jgi:hypothetical protein